MLTVTLAQLQAEVQKRADLQNALNFAPLADITEYLNRAWSRLYGKLSEEDKQYIAGAFRLLQNQFLHGPIAALTEETGKSSSHTLLDAFRKLFRLEDQE